MYQNRSHVRDIESKVRTSQVEHEKALLCATYNGMQLASYFHKIICEAIETEHERIILTKAIDKEYQSILTAKHNKKRG